METVPESFGFMLPYVIGAKCCVCNFHHEGRALKRKE